MLIHEERHCDDKFDDGDEGGDRDDDINGDDNNDDDDSGGVDCGRCSLFIASLLKTMLKRLRFECSLIGWLLEALEWKEGGGVRGGRGVSRDLNLGVPGCDSHMNGIVGVLL